MATIKTGMVDTEDILSDERVIDMSEKIGLLQPDDTQFTTMLMRLGAKDAIREKVNWLTDEYLPRTSALAVSATSADTVLTVTSGHGNTRFRIDNIVRVMETGEGLLVTGTSANSIAVTRGLGAIASAAGTSAQSASHLVIVGAAAAQGASSGTAQVVQRTLGYNYIQEQRNSLSFSTVQSKIELYGGREPAKEIRKKAVEHKRSIESTLFWGLRNQDTSASPGPRGFAGGAYEFLQAGTWLTSAGTGLTPVEFDTFCQGPYSYGSSNKVFFCAPTVASVLSQMYRDKWEPNTNSASETYGVKVDAFINGAFGKTLPIVVKKEWVDYDATSTNFGTMGFLLDMDYIRWRPLRELNTQLRQNIQEPSATVETHEYYTAHTLEFQEERCHGLLKGTIAYAAS